MGLLDILAPIIGGGSSTRATPSGAFGNLDEIGNLFADRIKGDLEDPTSTKAFQSNAAALRDYLDQQSATSRQRLGDTANASGFIDSGAVFSGLGDIERGKIQSFASGIQKLIADADRQSTGNAFNFLAAGASEHAGVQQTNIQADQNETSQLMNFLTTGAQMGLTAGGVGGFGSSGGGGGFASLIAAIQAIGQKKKKGD